MPNITQNYLEKLRRCLALADDVRGNPTTRETARRQAGAIMRRFAIGPYASPPVAPIDWSQRTSTEAAAAGLAQSVQCADGLYCPEFK